MPDNLAVEVLKKELGFEVQIEPSGLGVVIDRNGIRWFSRYQAELWQAALSREKRLEVEKERYAKICDAVDGFLMSGTPDMRKFYKMGCQDCAEAIRSSEDDE